MPPPKSWRSSASLNSRICRFEKPWKNSASHGSAGGRWRRCASLADSACPAESFENSSRRRSGDRCAAARQERRHHSCAVAVRAIADRIRNHRHRFDGRMQGKLASSRSVQRILADIVPHIGPVPPMPAERHIVDMGSLANLEHEYEPPSISTMSKPGSGTGIAAAPRGPGAAYTSEWIGFGRIIDGHLGSRLECGCRWKNIT